MKKIFIPLLLVFAVIFTSCDPTESPIYDGSQTLAYFDGTSGRIEVIINETGEITVPVNVSTLSDQPRTVSVSVDADNTTATPGQYSFNGSVTIPANSYFGSFVLTGIDDGLTTDGVTLTLQIDSVDGGVGSPEKFSATIIEICPIDADYFVGQYRIDQLTGFGGAPFASLNTVFGTQTVTVTGSGTTREFDFLYSPSTFASDFNMVLQLVCNNILIDGGIQSGSLSCNGGATQIGQGNASTPSTYDTSDDSVITLNITDFFGDEDGGCGPFGAGPYDIQITMTKL